MKINSTVRNVAIIAILAAIVDGLTAGKDAANAIEQVVSLAFLGSFAWFAALLYREHHTTLYSLGSKRRALLYGSAGLLALAFTALDRATTSGVGVVVWLLAIGAAVYAIYFVYRSSKQY